MRRTPHQPCRDESRNAGSPTLNNFGAVTFLDSAGVGFLLKLRRRADDMGVVLDVSNAQPQPFAVLRTVGLIQYLRVSATPTTLISA